ncbi:low temperature requirement protein A [Micromonospora sp. WMMD1102]|uniref:low temperature requirement protein A n=1 Tax=Micromonospora sp. WMMD1102 TaxID=3016105 RepID=UPI002415018D|nr:low temperature requirement protein A [Micromonospora sp. WMMD1102]MDG4787460.1 low temperature requirement protein A [Micromonospora sp. WMMD1102]
MTSPSGRPDVLRGPEDSRVTTIELFFDVVYVLAVTQLTELLLHRLHPAGAAGAAVLLLAVWWAWVDTAWITNWFDPDQPRVRVLLIALMGISLVMSSAVPEAYGDRGLWFAVAYVALAVGRTVFVASALTPRSNLHRNFQRVLVWRISSAPLWLAGGFASGPLRLGLWVAAVVLDTSAAACDFYVPGWGRSRPTEWAIHGSHLAERARLFVIIALGESILVTGTDFGALRHGWTPLAALVSAFLGTVALWWIYFDRSAEAARSVIVAAEEPGRLGRSAYTYLHIPMVAGIIVTAVGDDLTLHEPTGTADVAVISTVLGGPVLFLAGFLLFKRAILGIRSRVLLVAVVVLVALGPLGPLLSPLALSAVATAVVATAVARSALLAARRTARDTGTGTGTGTGNGRPAP